MGIAVLAWLAVLGIVFWGLAHVVSSLLLFIVAAILAYALAPAVTHHNGCPPDFKVCMVKLLKD